MVASSFILDGRPALFWMGVQLYFGWATASKNEPSKFKLYRHPVCFWMCVQFVFGWVSSLFLDGCLKSLKTNSSEKHLKKYRL